MYEGTEATACSGETRSSSVIVIVVVLSCLAPLAVDQHRAAARLDQVRLLQLETLGPHLVDPRPHADVLLFDGSVGVLLAGDDPPHGREHPRLPPYLDLAGAGGAPGISESGGYDARPSGRAGCGCLAGLRRGRSRPGGRRRGGLRSIGGLLSSLEPACAPFLLSLRFWLFWFRLVSSPVSPPSVSTRVVLLFVSLHVTSRIVSCRVVS